MNAWRRDPPLRVAIVGCGYLGRRVAHMLDREGVAITGVNRSGQWTPHADDADDLAHPPASLNMVALDLTLASAPDFVAALASASHWLLCYSSGGGQQDREGVYLRGLSSILDAAAVLRPQRLVYTSSTSALPDINGWVSDECPDWPTDARGRIQKQAEEILRQRVHDLALDAITLRLAGIYGPARALGRLYRSDPTRLLSGDGMQATNLIHRDDAAQAVVAALRCNETGHRTLNVCDDDHCTRRAMFEALARANATPPPRFECDPSPASARGKRVTNDAMKRFLGVVLRYPTHLPG